jgi:hypothetical protein
LLTNPGRRFAEIGQNKSSIGEFRLRNQIT